MDSALVKIIGPAYARLVNQPGNKNTSGVANNKLPQVGRFVNKPEQSKPVAPEVNNRPGQHNRFPIPQREKVDVNFQQLHKKQPSKFIRGVESRRDLRQSQLNLNRKMRRSELQTAGRPMLSEVSLISDDEVSMNESPQDPQLQQKKGQLKPRNGVPTPIVNNKANQPVARQLIKEPLKVPDRRKQQLFEYKKTKEELAKNANGGKRIPFKPGGVIAPAPAVAARNVHVAANVRNHAFPVEKAPTPGLNAKQQEAERRVTRAMAKGVVPVPVRHNPAALKPAIAQMKNLNINAKQQPNNIGGNLANHFPAQPKHLAKEPLGKPKVNKPVIVPNFAEAAKKAAPVKIQVEVVQDAKAVAPAVKIPKAKPKAIDAIYAKYNSQFAAACDALTDNSNYWVNIRKTNHDIPWGVKDDIDGTLGQATLMLNSKLPQFAQLLWQYIFPPTDDSPPVLDCDLAGWWDVAQIQVDQVLKTFAHLKCLEKNDWSEPVKDAELKEVSVKSRTKKKESASPKKSKLQEPAVSKFKIFLLNKKAAEAETVAPDVKVFDTGLFQIQSPASPARSTSEARRSMRLSALVQPGQGQLGTPKTPSGIGNGVKTPLSHRRLSTTLVQLSLQKSMGPLYRVGVIPEQHIDVSMSDDF